MMQHSVLYPPNCDSLGDDVIVHAVLRSGSSARIHILDDNCDAVSAGKNPAPTACSSPKISAACSKPHVFVVTNSIVKGLRTKHCHVSTSTGTAKRGRSLSSTPGQHNGNRLEAEGDSEAAIREQRRLRMARYRAKLRQRAVAGENDIRLLREEIKKLILQRHYIASGVPTKSTVWNVAVETFRLFRRGFYQVQLDFYQAVMAPDVMCNSTCVGVDALTEYWRFSNRCFPDLELRLLCLSGDGDNAVVATVVATWTITETALQFAFPHLMGNGEGGNRSPIADKLVGQKISARGFTRFEWDDETEKVTRLEYECDVLSPMLRVLGTLEDVSRVFDSALFTLDCKFTHNYFR